MSMGIHGVPTAEPLRWSETLIIQYTGNSSTARMAMPAAVFTQPCRRRRGSARSVIEGPPVRPKIDKGKQRRDHDEDVAECGALPEVELHERQVVGLGGDRLRRVRRAAAGQAEDDVQHL